MMLPGRAVGDVRAPGGQSTSRSYDQLCTPAGSLDSTKAAMVSASSGWNTLLCTSLRPPSG